MRELVYFIASSLDGRVAGPDGADPTGPDGFWPVAPDYVRHLASAYPETLPAGAREALGVTAEGTHFDTVLEGRKSYEIGLAAGVPDAYPHLRHLVFSRTLTETPAPAVELVADDPVARVRELKNEDGKDIWLVGGATLAGALYPEIDRLIVKLSPLTVGDGIPLFAGSAFDPRLWHLTDHTALESGVLFLSYRRVPASEVRG
ncbi:dihydrofolate reductase family protein [Streptomyces caniscabiei]|uniref:dihydrofolate reductase family protein n=1 Tax=Streptomyces caniscabiei TaxID=2746961 RepID=UPI0029BCEC63|nr:dihydrofolate reductase family protein [Streptomyces caniscabiei]MDX2602380.1 dihydrofolate reductase family protein [Streptomyces caniscabiei]MDX2734236.1 dihydrofolate reductase family protein [Streptomyces caniscabiei]MDX2781510.1 dihydrofolate reductase family protein [Streptomyces caniscabiei]